MFLKVIKNVDLAFVIPFFFLSLFGILTIYTPDSDLFAKQALWLAISLIFFVLFSNIDPKILKHRKIIWILMIVGIIMLSLVLILGSNVKGSKNRIYLGPLAFQSAEFVKIIVIAMLAKYFSKRHIEITHFKHILLSFLYLAFFVALIALQPDLGMIIVYLGIWAFMIFASGISKRQIIFLLSMAFAFFAFSWSFLLQDYQKQRIINFINPNQDLYGSGYNVHQAKIAIGSGGFWGKGVAFGSQSKLSFLPEYHTDFIFAAFAEEWGFVGVVIMMSLFGLIFYRLLKYALYSSDNFEKLFAIGVFAMIFVQFVIHIGMNLGVMPVTGLPLPFVSYGGSHLMAEAIALGIVSSFKKKAMF